ncbi:MAG: S53 family peptidase [Thermoplasmata archaeon]|nr:S53 family peptidase [Thermoplasmata archaeon]
MGFNPTLAHGVLVNTPAVAVVSAVLTLWPSAPSFFLTPGPNTPALTPAEVAAEYGLSPAQYSALAAYFVAHGLTIVHTWPDRLFLTVSGPASAVGAAFGTVERMGSYEGKTVVFPATAPSLPPRFASEVAAVTGLASDLSPFTIPFFAAPQPASEPASLSSPLQGRTTTLIRAPAVHTIYGLDALYNYSGTPHFASAVGIALLLWGDGYDPSDIATYFSNYYPSDLPVPTVRYYPVDGAPAPSAVALRDPSTGPQELTLDIEWSGSEAPGATLDAVYAPDGPQSNGYSPTDPSMVDALNEAVNSVSGVQVLSMSFGTNDGQDTSFQAAFTTAFHQASLEGITVLAASGDNGGVSGKSCQGNVAPQFPATSPLVLAVGGTAPILAENGLGTVTGLDSEPAWSGSGGGFSASYAAPSWQLVGSAATPIRASGMRGVPDIAGPAAQNAFYFAGTDSVGEGTSFATPIWSGMIAEMDAVRGHPLGLLTPRLYAVGALEGASSSGGLVDITSGGNCLGPAGPGWDTATGWGSPRALQLFQSLAGTFVAVTLSATPQPVAPGAMLTTTVRALNATSARSLPGLSVFLQVDSVSYTGPCGGTLATATGPTDANGTFSVGVPIPGCYFGTQVSLSVTVSGNGYYGSNQTTVNVNLDGLSGVLAALQQYPYNLIGFVLIMFAATSVGLLLSARHKRRIAARRRPLRPRGAGPSPPAGATDAPEGPAPPSPPTFETTPSVSTAPAGASGTSEVVATPVAVAPVASAASTAPVGDAGVCTGCGGPLPGGAASCPACGTPTVR